MVLKMSGIVKRFAGLLALDHVDFEVADSEVMALVGDNGAGKSTLIKTISGAHIPDEGEIRIQGELVRFRSPQDTWEKGIATIYQELALAGKMTVVDNVFLGREIKRPRFGIPFLDLPAMRKRTSELLNRLDMDITTTGSGGGTQAGGDGPG